MQPPREKNRWSSCSTALAALRPRGRIRLIYFFSASLSPTDEGLDQRFDVRAAFTSCTSWGLVAEDGEIKGLGLTCGTVSLFDGWLFARVSSLLFALAKYIEIRRYVCSNPGHVGNSRETRFAVSHSLTLLGAFCRVVKEIGALCRLQLLY